MDYEGHDVCRQREPEGSTAEEAGTAAGGGHLLAHVAETGTDGTGRHPQEGRRADRVAAKTYGGADAAAADTAGAEAAVCVPAHAGRKDADDGAGESAEREEAPLRHSVLSRRGLPRSFGAIDI